MNKLSAAVLLASVTAVSFPGLAGAQDSEALLKPFPSASQGIQRHVMVLPPLGDEQQHRIELVIGRKMVTDCNHFRLSGTLNEETVTGWGYSYYRVEVQPGALSTRMACPAGDKQTTLVTLPAAAQQLIRYNSKLPLVVYAPEGIEVSYRVWQAGDTLVPSEIR